MSGQSILRLMHQEGLRPNIWTYTSLVSIYAKCAARGPAQTSLAEGAKVRKEMAAGGRLPRWRRRALVAQLKASV
jgi:hypothetical protein